MDIMDSSDTPSGGLSDSSTGSGRVASRRELPLSVDERDDDATSPLRPAAAGMVPTHPNDNYRSADLSSSSAAPALADNADINAMPTSTDDVMMPMQEHTTHSSLLSHSTTASSSSSTSAAMQRTKDSARDTTASAKAGAASMADSVKSTAKSAMASVESGLHHVEERAADAYHDVADKLHHKQAEPDSPHLEVRFAARPEATDKHPDAASMRDVHMHTPLASLPTHANEVHGDTPTHVSDTYQRGLDAAAATQAPEPKDSSASGGVMGALSSLHAKLESGAEAVKGAVDKFAEQHLRSSPRDGDHLSSAHARDLPTLVDPTNEYNNSQIRAKLQPAHVRAGSAAAEASDMATDEELGAASV